MYISINIDANIYALHIALISEQKLKQRQYIEYICHHNALDIDVNIDINIYHVYIARILLLKLKSLAPIWYPHVTVSTDINTNIQWYI